jgi:hypothetical protein
MDSLSRMKQIAILGLVILGFSMYFTGTSSGYSSWTGGCNTCHGDFAASSYTSPKGGTWPDNLHNVHRSSSYMGTSCTVCHQATGDNPPLNKSGKTAYNVVPGYGCDGCHGNLYGGVASGMGLRQYHRKKLASTCSGSSCHTNPEVPVAENINPPNYGGSLTKANDACNNPTAYLEDYSGDHNGLDNDGNGLRDTADPSCAAVTATPTSTPVRPTATASPTTGLPTFTPTRTVATATPTIKPTNTPVVKIPEGKSGYFGLLIGCFGFLLILFGRKLLSYTN